MELMVSAALLPSLLLCLCCLWCQMRSQWKAARKVGDGVSDGRWGKDGRSKGRRFSADELSGIGEIGGSDDDGSPRKRGPKTLPSRETARAKDLSRECKQQNSWQSIAARSKEQVRSRAQSTSWWRPQRSQSTPAARRGKLHSRRIACRRCHPNMLCRGGRERRRPVYRKLPSIRSAALANAALQVMGDAPQPHRPSPMPPGRSAPSGDLTSIQDCRAAQHRRAAAKRPPPAPPSGPVSRRCRANGRLSPPSRWATLGASAAGAQAGLGVAAGAQGETTATPAAHELAASTALAEPRLRRAEKAGGWEPERKSA